MQFVGRPEGTPLGLILVGLGLLGGAAVGMFHLDSLPFSFCFFKSVTGLPCMSCGATRAVGRLARGDLRGAWLMNPVATVSILGLLPWGLADLVLLTRRRSLGIVLAPAARRVLGAVAVLLILANWAYLVAAGR